MKKPVSLRAILLAGLIVASSLPGAAQPSQKSHVDERNVRAAMQFLASDAMQGRGSGTMFERITAEYVGSQFMQFGLEPAGEKGRDGKSTYVQAVETTARPRLESLQLGRTQDLFTIGKEWVVLSISAPDVTGNFKTLTPSEPAAPGEIVLLKLNEDDRLEFIQPKINELIKNGAVAVLLTETKELRERWSQIAGRRPSMSTRGTVIAVNKQVEGFLGNMTWQEPLELHAKFGPAEKGATWNAVGKITGTDKTQSADVILLSSHLDHIGVQENAPGDDKIFNGADDDASGTVAVMELARILAAGKKPKRTIFFACFGSEEAGGHGSRYFVSNLGFPKEKLIANLQFEMIGRPDAKVKAEELWLTGYERSNLGSELAKHGARLVQDPHPDQNFFFRSDNITLARQGIVAHTVSSFGLHTDYHRASDELRTIDFMHMTRSISAMVAPIEWLVNSSFVPAWIDGKKP
ncbi:MAG: M20/M25/M40 family metallo-hydrolase [Pyrinomonadaceae bacterium]